jgi:hemerythrin-like domain-containing protein
MARAKGNSRKSTGMGRKRGSEAREKNDAITLLTHQHREVAALFERLEKIAEKDEEQAGRIFEEIADRLAIHISIEEQHFYPSAAREDEDLQEDLRKALEEHLAVKRVIADLLDTEPGDETFLPKVRVLHELFQHHREEEEKQMFPQIRKDLGEEQLRELASDMREMVDELKQGTPRDEVPSQTDSAPALM